MKLKPMTVYHTKDGYWLYTGFFKQHGEVYPYFTCDHCNKLRFCHEFLLYSTLEDIQNDIAKDDFGRWHNNAHYGSECVKAFITNLKEITA